MTRIEFTIPADHPALPGHFPGHPIVPGVVILDTVVRAIARGLPAGARINGAPAIKFLAPLLPGAAARIELSPPANGIIRFTVSRDSTTLATGQFSIAS
jgi:3-hydroxymyristoyl/3-hydroxydecanoyl-(acyl carrier protein) dehydratase